MACARPGPREREISMLRIPVQAAVSLVAVASVVGLATITLPACSSSSSGGSSGDGGSDASKVDSAAADTGTGPSDGGAADTATSTDAADSAPEAAADAGVATNVLYVETNDITPGQNAVLAFARASDGSLTPLTGSPFSIGGTGVGNPTQGLGPDDSDQEILASPDHTRLFAVNAGSNTIAVLDIHADGSLTPVSGSPFPSGGIDPVSVGLSGNFLYVVNQDEDPAQDAGAGSPNYTAFTVAANGTLTPIPSSTVSAGVSPSVALVSPDGKILFGSDFLAPLKSMPAQPPLRAFAIGASGTLTPAPGTPMAIPYVDGGSPPGTPVALGLAVHPTQKVLYVDFTLRGEVGAYSYDDTTGALTYVATATLSGPAPCWVRVSADGNFLYVTDTANDSVSVLDSSNALAPTEIQNLQLHDPGSLLGDASPATASESYEEALSPDGKFLYVLSQRSTTSTTITTGNILHVLSIGSDGKLTETVADVPLSVPLGTRPQGVVVF
jgi:DNA-binding beta-propeller fold protein YncE